MNSRKGSKLKWQMANDNETWIARATLINVDLIYNFLLSKSDLEKKHKPYFSYSEIAKAIHKDLKQVQFACQKMAYKVDPVIRIRAERIICKNGIRTSEKVQLLRLQ